MDAEELKNNQEPTIEELRNNQEFLDKKVIPFIIKNYPNLNFESQNESKQSNIVNSLFQKNPNKIRNLYSEFVKQTSNVQSAVEPVTVAASAVEQSNDESESESESFDVEVFVEKLFMDNIFFDNELQTYLDADALLHNQIELVNLIHTSSCNNIEEAKQKAANFLKGKNIRVTTNISPEYTEQFYLPVSDGPDLYLEELIKKIKEHPQIENKIRWCKSRGFSELSMIPERLVTTILRSHFVFPVTGSPKTVQEKCENYVNGYAAAFEELKKEADLPEDISSEEHRLALLKIRHSLLLDPERSEILNTSVEKVLAVFDNIIDQQLKTSKMLGKEFSYEDCFYILLEDILREVGTQKLTQKAKQQILEKVSLGDIKGLFSFSDEANTVNRIPELTKDAKVKINEAIKSLDSSSYLGSFPEIQTDNNVDIIKVDNLIRQTQAVNIEKASIEIPRVPINENIRTLFLQFADLKQISGQTSISFNGVEYAPFFIDINKWNTAKEKSKGDNVSSTALIEAYLTENKAEDLLSPALWRNADVRRESAIDLIKNNLFYRRLCQIVTNLRKHRKDVRSLWENKNTGNKYNPLSDNQSEQEEKIRSGEIEATFTSTNSFKRNSFTTSNPFYLKLKLANEIEDYIKQFEQQKKSKHPFILPDKEVSDLDTKRIKDLIKANSTEINNLLAEVSKSSLNILSNRETPQELLLTELEPIFTNYTIEQKSRAKEKATQRQKIEKFVSGLKEVDLTDSKYYFGIFKEDSESYKFLQDNLDTLKSYVIEYLEGTKSFNDKLNVELIEYIKTKFPDLPIEFIDRLQTVVNGSLKPLEVDDTPEGLSDLFEIDWVTVKNSIKQGSSIEDLPSWVQQYLQTDLTSYEKSIILDNPKQFFPEKEGNINFAQVQALTSEQKKEFKVNRLEAIIDNCKQNNITRLINQALFIGDLNSLIEKDKKQIEESFKEKIEKEEKELESLNESTPKSKGRYNYKKNKISEIETRLDILKKELSGFVKYLDELNPIFKNLIKTEEKKQEFIEDFNRFLSETPKPLGVDKKYDIFNYFKKVYLQVGQEYSQTDFVKYNQRFKEALEKKQELDNKIKAFDDSGLRSAIERIVKNTISKSSVSLRLPIVFTSEDSSAGTTKLSIPYFDKLAADYGIEISYDKVFPKNKEEQSEVVKILLGINAKNRQEATQQFQEAIAPSSIIGAFLTKEVQSSEPETVPSPGGLTIPIRLAKEKLIEGFKVSQETVRVELSKFPLTGKIDQGELAEIFGITSDNFEKVIVDYVKDRMLDSTVYRTDIKDRRTPVLVNSSDINEDTILMNKVQIYKPSSRLDSAHGCYLIKLDKLNTSDKLNNSNLQKRLPLKVSLNETNLSDEEIVMLKKLYEKTIKANISKINEKISYFKSQLEKKVTDQIKDEYKEILIDVFPKITESFNLDEYIQRVQANLKSNIDKNNGIKDKNELKKQVNNNVPKLLKSVENKIPECLSLKNNYSSLPIDKVNDLIIEFIDPNFEKVEVTKVLKHSADYSILISDLKEGSRRSARLLSILDYFSSASQDVKTALVKVINSKTPEGSKDLTFEDLKLNSLTEFQDQLTERRINNDASLDVITESIGVYFENLPEVTDEGGRSAQPEFKAYAKEISNKFQLFKKSNYLDNTVYERGKQKLTGAKVIWVDPDWINEEDSFVRTIKLIENFN